MRTGISWLDVKLGARMLVKHPGLTLVGGLGMAVAIAIGAGFYDATTAVAYSTIPLDEGDRIVALENWDAEASNQERQSLHDFVTWRAELRTVREVSAFRDIRRNLIVPGRQPEQVVVAQMTASGFGLARVRPLLGRTLAAQDEREGAPPVIVLGHDAWRTRFGGDRAILGRRVRLGNAEHTVVGVMPEGFAFPVDHGFWTPLRVDTADYARRAGPGIGMFGRLAPGATLAQAKAELAAIGRRTAAATPRTHAHLRPRIVPYTAVTDMLDDTGLWEIQVMRFVISLLLVVVCANVAILVYARTATRMGEIALRTALGASRRRIVTQLFVEALVLSALAAAVGLGVARMALGQLVTLLPPPGSGEFPFWIRFGLSPGTVAYVLALALLAAVIVGVLPALQATGSRLQSGLRELNGGTAMRLGRTWTVLIVAQVAFSVAILPVALFNAWEWIRYGLAEPGRTAEQFLVATVGMDRDVAPTAQAQAYERAFQARFAERTDALSARLRADPAVAAVAVSSNAPGEEPIVWVEVQGVATPGQARGGHAVRAGTAGHQVRTGRVDPGFFRAFGVPVLAGRAFGPGDVDTAAAAVVVNRSFVRDVLDGGGAMGRRVRIVGLGGDVVPDQVRMGRWYRIAGVVGDFPNAMEPGGTEARVYQPLVPGQVYPASLAVRVRGMKPAAFAGRLRQTAGAVDPTLRLGRTLPLDQVMRSLQVMMRVTALAISLVALSVLLLSAAGIYALMSFTVTRRRREIGIRAALGADPRRILRGIFSRAAGQLGIGVVAGLAVALLLERLSVGEVMDGRALVLLPAVSALMVAVGLLAAAGPARQALRIQPGQALREE